MCAYACALCLLYFHFVELAALHRGRVSLPVVKEELLSLQNGTFGEDSNAVVSVHHNHCNATHEIQRIIRLFSCTRCLNSGVTAHQNKSHLLRSSWDLQSGWRSGFCSPFLWHPRQSLLRTTESDTEHVKTKKARRTERF